MSCVDTNIKPLRQSKYDNSGQSQAQNAATLPVVSISLDQYSVVHEGAVVASPTPKKLFLPLLLVGDDGGLLLATPHNATAQTHYDNYIKPILLSAQAAIPSQLTDSQIQLFKIAWFNAFSGLFGADKTASQVHTAIVAALPGFIAVINPLQYISNPDGSYFFPDFIGAVDFDGFYYLMELN